MSPFLNPPCVEKEQSENKGKINNALKQKIQPRSTTEWSERTKCWTKPEKPGNEKMASRGPIFY